MRMATIILKKTRVSYTVSDAQLQDILANPDTRDLYEYPTGTPAPVDPVLPMPGGDYAINTTIPLAQNTVMLADGSFSAGGGSYAMVRFIVSRGSDAAVAVNVLEKNLSAEFSDINVKSEVGGFSIEPTLKTGTATGKVRLFFIPNP